MIVWGLIPLAFSGYTVALPLYTKATFGWGEKELGYFFAVVGLTAAVVQGYVFGKLVRRLGERTMVRAGTLGMAVSIAVVPLLSSSTALYAWTIALAFSNSVASPALTGLVSIYAGPAAQGTILGAAQAVSALGRMLGPSLFGTLYDVASAPAAFLAEGAVMLGGAVVTTALAPVRHAGVTDSGPPVGR
jgi:MFS family permease